MRKNLIELVAVALALALAGCSGKAPVPTASPSAPDAGAPATANAPEDPSLVARKVDYGAALRTASIKLVGALPTLDEMAGVTDATSYAAQIDKYLADPRFSQEMLSYFQDMFKMGGPAATMPTPHPSFDTAPTFAAELVVKGRPMTDLFTATTNTCPTLNSDGTFTDAACAPQNGQATVGVLTDPGAMAQYYSNMAFRRVRWVQETFDCTRFPAEYSAKPSAMGSGQYTSPWSFNSIAGGGDRAAAPINFQDTSSVICANCHTTMNHIAPLFANFDAEGAYQATIQVHTPSLATPLAKLSDWLPAGEQLAWRLGKPVHSLTELGAAMAADPEVTACQVQRAWNWAMSKTDIVDDLAIVPATTIAQVNQLFTSSGYKLKPLLKAIFTSDDFVRF